MNAKPKKVSRYEPPKDLDALENEVVLLSAHTNAATYRLLCCIRELDEREAYAAQGFRSMAHWLNWKVGLSLGAAREKVRVARALAGLPKIGEALSKAQVSYAKVRAMTRIATPETEDYLLEIGTTGTASHVEKLVRKVRGATRAEELATAQKRHEVRSLHTFYDEDGVWTIRGKLPAELGALVDKALDAAQAELTASKGHSDYGQTRADALAQVATASMVNLSGDGPVSTSDCHQVVVHVGVDTLRQSDVPAETCAAGDAELDGGPYIPAETSRRLACDASVVRLVEAADGTPLDVGRKTRVLSTPLKRALLARDGGCRYPGCSNRIVDAHHLVHWADGGHTKLSNLTSLCKPHHIFVHEHGFRVAGDGSRPLFFAPGANEPIPSCGSAPELPNNAIDVLVREHEEQGLQFTPMTGLPTWQGEKMDYDWAARPFLR